MEVREKYLDIHQCQGVRGKKTTGRDFVSFKSIVSAKKMNHAGIRQAIGASEHRQESQQIIRTGGSGLDS